MTVVQRDNSTFHEKVTLRKKALEWLDHYGVSEPIVFEAFGGEGHLFNACYSHLDTGVVIEKDSIKASRLASQRPSWRVYEGDSIGAMAAGVGGDLAFDLLDIDPYGSCWAAIEAFFQSDRTFADRMIVVVQDGLRLKLAAGNGWEMEVLEPMIMRYGNDLHPVYQNVCHDLLELKAAQAGYALSRFGSYYTGHSKAMTHFIAVLEKN
jgi:hypothetical protein